MVISRDVTWSSMFFADNLSGKHFKPTHGGDSESAFKNTSIEYILNCLGILLEKSQNSSVEWLNTLVWQRTSLVEQGRIVGIQYTEKQTNWRRDVQTRILNYFMRWIMHFTAPIGCRHTSQWRIYSGNYDI